MSFGNARPVLLWSAGMLLCGLALGDMSVRAAEDSAAPMVGASELSANITEVVTDTGTRVFVLTFDRGRASGLKTGQRFHVMHRQVPGMAYDSGVLTRVGESTSSGNVRYRSTDDAPIVKQSYQAVFLDPQSARHEGEQPLGRKVNPMVKQKERVQGKNLNKPTAAEMRQKAVATELLAAAEIRDWQGLGAAADMWRQEGPVANSALDAAVREPLERLARWLKMQNAWRELLVNAPPQAKYVADLVAVEGREYRLDADALSKAPTVVRGLRQSGDDVSAVMLADGISEAIVQATRRDIDAGKLEEAAEWVSRGAGLFALSGSSAVAEMLDQTKLTLANLRREQLFNRMRDALVRADLPRARAVRAEIAEAMKAREISVVTEVEMADVLRLLDDRLSLITRAAEALEVGRRAAAVNDLEATVAALGKCLALYKEAGLTKLAILVRDEMREQSLRLNAWRDLQAALSTLEHAELAILSQKAGRRSLSRSNRRKWKRWLDNYERKNASILAIHNELRTRIASLRRLADSRS